MQNNEKNFFGGGFFDWQFSKVDFKTMWDERKYDEDKYWGGFSRQPVDMSTYKLPYWALAGFKKHNKPVLFPTKGGWDCGHFGGGVHNGALLVKDDTFFYIYRGEFPISEDEMVHPNIDYKCDVGVAISKDGINYTKPEGISPIFRSGEDKKYSFEDVNVVEHEGKYYMFLNRWDWANFDNPAVSGVYLAVSGDLLKWEKAGLVFPDAKRIHRNPCVLQNPQNKAVKANGKFIMYINDGLIAYSDDLINWESSEMDSNFPGGEGCFALTDYDRKSPDNILLFTGGHHTGHFYAVGEVLFKKDNPAMPIEWLPRPVLTVEEQYPWENGLSYEEPHIPVSHWRDTIFFTGMTMYKNKWWAMYGGSEYYTCLATSDDIKN
ncbi:MAG: hypothetical protein AB9835_11355 [Eubacteriales bacterium]